MEVQLHKRVLKFVRNLQNSENKCIQLCADLMMNGSGSAVFKSLNYIASVYNITKCHIGFNYTNIVNRMHNSIVFNECDKKNAGNVHDLCYIRDNKSTLFSVHEVNVLLEYICTQ